MASISKKEKKELMNKISLRIEKEKNSFNNKLSKFNSGDIEVDVLDNVVKQFYEALDDDYFAIEEYADEELKTFFSEQYSMLGIMEKMVYEIEPNIFKTKVNSLSNKIAMEYNICLNSSLDFSNHLDSLKDYLMQLKSFIYRNVVNDEEFANDERFKPVIDEAKSSIDTLEKEIVNLQLKNDSFKNKIGASKKKKADDKVNVLDKYISNLNGKFYSIIELYPDKKVNLVDIGMCLTNLKNNNAIDIVTLDDDLEKVRQSLLKNFNYDIESDVIVKNNNIEKIDNDIDDKSSMNLNPDDINYASLESTINLYLKEFEDNEPVILNNDAPGTADDKYGKFSGYRDTLFDLLKEIENKSRSSQDIKNDFLQVTENISNDLWYQYNSHKKNRRRKVISVKKLGLGLGGLALGTYGISTLVFNLSFFYRFGFLYPSVKPFFIPVALTIISGIMLKKALSSVEKKVVTSVFNKLKNEKNFEDKDSKLEKGNDEVKEVNEEEFLENINKKLEDYLVQNVLETEEINDDNVENKKRR